VFVAAIFGGICNHTFNHEWNLHHACLVVTLQHNVPKIWWYSCAFFAAGKYHPGGILGTTIMILIEL
jgi:hypothetical protein